jgi:SSS family solute:Na+ symporter
MIYLLFTAVQFNGLASLLKVWGGVGFEVAVTVTAVTTIIYTAFAGIKSDFYTDAVHFCVIALVLLGVLVPSIWISTDGLTALESLPKSYFDPFAFGGLAYFLGGIIFGVGVVFVSMELWQRIYASTDERTARRALIGSAAVVFPFYFAAALAGMAARVITPSLPDRDLALFAVMKSVLPTGVLGLGLAAFVAVFISSVNTMMMVVSATLTKDVYKTFIRPEANDKQTLLVGRALTLVSGILGLLVSYLVRDIITLSILALFLLLIFLPSVVGGFFWRRSTAKASLASILVGLISTLCALPYMPNTAFVPGFLLSVIVFVVTSLTTQHDDSETIDI